MELQLWREGERERGREGGREEGREGGREEETEHEIWTQNIQNYKTSNS